MNRKLHPLLLVVATFPAYGNTYLCVEQAQKLMFGEVKFTPVTIQLADATRATMENRSSVHESFKADRIWRTPNGSFSSSTN